MTPDAYAARQACETLQPGMTHAQVLKIMGKPRRATTHQLLPGELWLEYDVEAGASGPITIMLDQTDAVAVVKETACEGVG
jgi:hypothetical protein